MCWTSGARFAPVVVVVVGVCMWCGVSASRAAEPAAQYRFLAPLDDQVSATLRQRPIGRDFAAAALRGVHTDRMQRRTRPRLDLSPLIGAAVGFLRRSGLPLEAQRDEDGRRAVGVYADVNVAEGLPAVSFHLGDRPREPLGAFYAGGRGFRCALVWPVHRFTLRVEAGEDSEFGYFGIAGVQWVHPKLPLAAGLGIPMNLNNADGDVGLIFQFRMTLP